MKKQMMMGFRLWLAVSMAILSAAAPAAEFVKNDSETAPQIFGAKVFKGDEIALFDLSLAFGQNRDYVADMDVWVMMPIHLSDAKEKVTPVLVYGSASGKDISASVMTDDAVRKLFWQDQYEDEWTDDGLNGSRTVRGIEKSGTWYEWPKGYWEDGSDPLRAWIVVKPKDAKGRRNFLPTYRVGLAGTDVVSPVITIYEDGAQCQKADALFGGGLKFAGLRGGEIMTDGGSLDERYCLELAGSGLKITVPSAGRLVLKGMDFDFGWYGRWYEDDLWIEADENGSEKGYQMFPSGNFGEIDIYATGRFISERPEVSKDGTVEIVCSGMTTVIVRGWRWSEWGDSDTEEFVDEMYLKGVAFYPAGSPSAVAVTTSALATRVSPKGEEMVMWPGTVTGAGSYVPGERVTLTATGLNGNVFDRWECDNPDVVFADAHAASTTFTVPSGVSGSRPEVVVRAVWKNVKDVFVRTSPLGAGTPTAYGRATVLGEVLPVTVKNVSKTQTLRSWSDGGEAKLSRNYMVTADAVQDLVALYADFPKLAVMVMPGSEGMGTVNTAVNKGYPTGSKVSFKATAAKNHVFAGWYADSNCEEPLAGTVDYRTASYSYVTKAEDETIYALFVPTTEDQNIVLSVDDGEGPREVTSAAADTVFNTAGELTLALDVESVSLPKITVSGLPSGLKFTAKEVLNKDKTVLAEANTIYGTATKPGTYVVTAKLTNTTVKKAIEKKFTIVVDNLTGANDCFREAIDNGSNDKYAISAGVTDLSTLPSLALTNLEAKLSVSGLPAGLKYNAKRGEIEGVATKAGTYTVYLTVTEGKVKKVSTITLDVAPLPAWAVGTFDGLMGDSKEGYFGLSITVSTVGKISAKVFGGKATHSVKGTLTRKDGNQYVAELDLTGKDWSDHIEINVSERDSTGCGQITGTFTEIAGTESMSATIEANQNTWSSKTLVLPPLKTGTYWLDGGGLVYALKIGAKGKVTVGAYDSYWAKKPSASGSAQIAVWPDGNGWRGRIPFLIVMDKSKGEGVADWIDVSIEQDGTMTFSPFPEHDALPLNWFVGTYTGRASDHVVITGYFNETMGATVSIAVKQSGDATATINWDDGSRDTYSLKCYEGSLTPDSCTLKASYADRLQGAKLNYDVSMTITRNRDSVPTATFRASSSGYLYVRTIYGYDTIYYSDTLQNESELRKK